MYAPSFSTRISRSSSAGLATSLALHFGIIASLLLLADAVSRHRGSVEFIAPGTGNALLIVPESLGGGGGGGLDVSPASPGRLTRFDEQQLAPPAAVVRNAKPLLAVEPTLIGATQMPADSTWDVIGLPGAAPGPPSNGPGSNGGIGDGNRGGVGSSDGPGFGPGKRGGIGGTGVYEIGGSVKAPQLIEKVEPEYSEEARKQRYQGSVMLSIEVWPDGRAHNIRVERGLGLGLDEKAVRAVAKWRFRPGSKSGKPVRVTARVQVTFRLL